MATKEDNRESPKTASKVMECILEFLTFLKANPKYENVSVEDFNFTSPKVMEDTIPEDGKKVDVSGSGNRKSKASKDAA